MFASIARGHMTINLFFIPNLSRSCQSETGAVTIRGNGALPSGSVRGVFWPTFGFGYIYVLAKLVIVHRVRPRLFHRKVLNRLSVAVQRSLFFLDMPEP